MLKAKYGLQQQDMIEVEDILIPEVKPVCQQQQQEQQSQLQQEQEPELNPEEPLHNKQHEQQQQQQQLHQQQNNNSKRKSMEDGLSQDRTRPRYNGLTTVASN